MPVIIIDGPEKAGKTTFVRALADSIDATIRKQSGPAEPDYTCYYHHLIEDIKADRPVVWDRAWPSEWVYGTLMLDRHIPDPFTMEELLAPLAAVRIMVLGPGTPEQFEKRSYTDLPIDPYCERELFKKYGRQFGWTVFENQYSQDWLNGMVNIVHGLVLISDKNKRARQLVLPLEVSHEK